MLRSRLGSAVQNNHNFGLCTIINPNYDPLIQINKFFAAHYPHPYSPKTHCRYDFIGNSVERVRVVFTDFNLYHPDKNATE